MRRQVMNHDEAAFPVARPGRNRVIDLTTPDIGTPLRPRTESRRRLLRSGHGGEGSKVLDRVRQAERLWLDCIRDVRSHRAGSVKGSCRESYSRLEMRSRMRQ